MMESPIYLDHATTTGPSDYLVQQMQPFFRRHWHCPTAPYLKGKEPFATINQKIRKIKTSLGAGEKDTFVLTSCAAEAISHIYHALAIDEASETGKNHFVTTPIEDASFLMGINRFEALGIQKKLTPLNNQGVLTPENLMRTLTPRTSLVSLSWANGLTGILHPIAELAEVCKEKGVAFHVDVSDILGKLYFRFEDLPIDYLTFDGDRFHGPKGTGGLLIRHPHTLSPLIPDGTQQHGLRGGTLNLPGLVGLGIAFEEQEEHFNHVCMETARLRNHFETSIESALPETLVLFREISRLPNVSVIAFPGVTSELLAFHLAQQDVFASFGGGRHQKLPALLETIGINPDIAKCALSFSLGRGTTQEEIQRAVGILADTAAKCRTFSEKVKI
jgi:cysteine desulfurase